MSVPFLEQRTRSVRTWIALGVLAPVGMLIVSIIMLEDLRDEAWNKARQTSTNLMQAIERDIERNVEVIDLSLRNVIENAHSPQVSSLSPELRQLVLFERAATARDMGAIFVLDEEGNAIVDSRSVSPRKFNFADRAYFQVHKVQPDLGLHISGPLISRPTGLPVIILSRRIDKPDGSFGGVALATLNLSYFTQLYERLGLGRHGMINLFLRDGTRLVRHPPSNVSFNLSQTPSFQRILREKTGTAVAVARSDGIKRLFAFTLVADLPLILEVGLATDEIEKAWRTKALAIGAIVLTLCSLTIGLSLLFGRELRRRAAMEAELARLSLTDALTGLANRRRFDDAFEASWRSARRTQLPLSLLIVDADHFKRFNDLYGHVVGDEVLKAIATCLCASVRRPADLVCRTGGEEFVVLLPDTDHDGAMRVANRIHDAIARADVAALGIRAASVTVSIGLATDFGNPDMLSGQDLYRLADTALYDAKRSGRNRTQCAAADFADQAELRPVAIGVG